MSLQNNQRLVIDEKTLKSSMMALKLTVLADTMITYLLQPSYAIIVDSTAHPDSFPSTEPFNFNTATYFMPMMQLVGVAISNSITGVLSDKLGRKPVLLACTLGPMVGCIVKWFCRKSFWAFCIAQLVSGLFSGCLPVALAYISDAYESKTVKDKEFGKSIAIYVLGISVGGLVAVLMYPQGLFAPLWAGAGIMAVVFCINVKFIIEPGKLKVMSTLNDLEADEEETGALSPDGADNEQKAQQDDGANAINEPESIEKTTMSLIIFGSFADIFGSKCLFPMCLSPLAYETFHQDFVQNDENPILSVNGFLWMGVFLGLLVMPSAYISPKIFQKIGIASGCVVGNVVTGLLTMALLLIANVNPPSKLTFAFFLVSLYAGFPFTVLSQLSTSPMLDRISPKHQRGLVQGIYTAFYNLANAMAPWLLGMLSDGTSTNTMIWVGIAISFAAALINLPLTFQKRFAPAKKEEVPLFRIFESTLTDEDEASWEEKVKNGEYIPAQILNEINFKRSLEQKPLLCPTIGTYAEDKDRLEEIRKQAKDDFRFLTQRSNVLLSKINDPDMPKVAADISRGYNSMESNHEELGQWFGEYMKDNGYIGPQSSQAIKLMITKAFPTLYNQMDGLNEDNFEQALVNAQRVFNHYIGGEIEQKEKYSLLKIFKSNAKRL